MDGPGFPNIGPFVSEWHVRVTWIAFATLFVIWGLCWVVRHVFGSPDEIAATNMGVTPHAGTTTTTTAAGDPAATAEAGGAVPATSAHPTSNKMYGTTPVWGQGILNRLNRGHNLMRDLLLMLLSVLVLNTFARGSTRAVMIIAWIYVAFAIVFLFVETSLSHNFVQLGYTLLFYALALAILGLSFAYGFY